jgi:hypothetical protein
MSEHGPADAITGFPFDNARRTHYNMRKRRNVDGR